MIVVSTVSNDLVEFDLYQPQNEVINFEAPESMSDFLENQLSNRNSDGTMLSSTFNSVYWGVFSTRKSDVLGT